MTAIGVSAHDGKVEIILANDKENLAATFASSSARTVAMQILKAADEAAAQDLNFPGVHVLSVTLSDDDEGFITGLEAVYATQAGALCALDDWLLEQSIDLDMAHEGQMITETFIGDDVEMLFDGEPCMLHWGVNQQEVHA